MDEDEMVYVRQYRDIYLYIYIVPVWGSGRLNIRWIVGFDITDWYI